MGAGVMQQGPHLHCSVGSAAQRNADNDLLHVHHYDPVNEPALAARWGKKWGKVRHRFLLIPADLNLETSA
jgi:hypothetical protein